LYECETWSLTPRENYIGSVTEQGVEENVWNQERGSNGRIEKTTIIVLFSTNYYYDHIKEDEMESVCGMNGKDEKCIQNFNWKR
jgi:hypothetical protein